MSSVFARPILSVLSESGSRLDPEREAFRRANDLGYDPVSEYMVCKPCKKKFYEIADMKTHLESEKHERCVHWAEWDRCQGDATLARCGDPARGIPAEIECRGEVWFKCTICNGADLWDEEQVRIHV